MASTNITSVDNHFEHHPPGTMQPKLQPSKEDTIVINLSMGLTLPSNKLPYTVNVAAIVAGRRVDQ